MLISIKNVIFQGGGVRTPYPPPLDPHMVKHNVMPTGTLCWMRGSRKFCQMGLTLRTFVVSFFLVDEVREDPTTTKSGPSSARQQNTIEMAFLWRADNSPILNAGLVAL